MALVADLKWRQQSDPSRRMFLKSIEADRLDINWSIVYSMENTNISMRFLVYGLSEAKIVRNWVPTLRCLVSYIQLDLNLLYESNIVECKQFLAKENV